ncbi:MAG TPA: CTP synthase [Candidatus Onthenecus intestinigallinarum]|uniref:CTP synthase n=1 Tax=Candidatus Onthenecus intestinigallinarum TaxID=2840875 RepID=A0A9D0ZBY5_9FIRM|nr:CTP synthase [Candidatus Onthenecus intestinigallinarum]
MNTKFLFVTGGVVSSLGKGITAASLGRLLKCRGLRVSIQKFDPYINVDPGTMNPYQHGEVFVTDDGAETDLDLGHYERFIDESLTQAANVTSGRVYWTVISRERKGGYLGATIQVIPHITDEIKRRVLEVAHHEPAPDVVITEIGGTVGDIESQPFLEAIRQLRTEVGRENSLYIHVTLVPYIAAAGELKTKPTQHSVKELAGLGIQPDMIVCRAEHPIPREMRDKIAMFCNVAPENVFDNQNARSIYEVPLLLHAQNLDGQVCRLLGIDAPEADLTEWRAMVERQLTPQRTARIALVGKYVELPDAYLSIVEALTHGGIAHHARVQIDWVPAEELTDENAAQRLGDAQGVLVPGGFGARGLEGKIAAVRYAREHGVPFLGICLGMQMAVVEFARDVAGLRGAHTTEVDPATPYPVIDLMPDQQHVDEKGGTMRLGAYRCRLAEGSRAMAAYGETEVSERHRHRYEFNEDFRERLEAAGMRVTGVNPERGLAEIVEIPAHPFFVGVQFHPELRSRPNRPHPLFRDFVGAALAR